MNKKELKKQYAQTELPMGVYRIKNLANGKLFIDGGLNIHGKMNGCKFQLSHGSHLNKALQEDFNKFGVDKFSFEILDLLEHKEEAKADYRDDLKILEEMWIEKLQPFGESGYHKRNLK
ncbi:GIY-YIG nuclease family protein [bacterium]|nr:GIY-YIG nuclease family protein [bacterium]